MKNLRKVVSILLILVLMLSTAAFAAEAATTTVYVSSVGSASGDGTAENPFATLAQAKEAVSGLNGATVIFKSGKYHFNDTVTFTEADSGVTYKADNDADVVFTGALPLNKNLFTKVEDASILKKLPASSRSKVYMLDLTKQGVEISEQYPALYVNDTEATIARYPNEGYVKAESATGTTSFDIANAANWTITDTDDVTLVGSLSNGYVWSSTKVASNSGATVTLEKTIRKNAYYFVRNLIEELDAPGEYIIKDNILYYYPIADLATLDMEIVTFSGSTMIEINGGEDITFDGITFEKSNSQAITTASKYTTGVSIINCSFKYIIKTVLDIRGYDHVISDNYAYGCGGRFINFQGGAKANLTPGNILITKNRIVACGNWNPSIVGTIKGGIDSTENWICIGNEVSHNIIQDCNTASAINVTGNNNIIKYNEIINQGRIIEDGGAIYSGKSATKYGTVVSHNYLHDFNLENDYSALYPDDGMSGITMEYNIIARVSKAMVSGLGANNNISNNLLIDVSRGLGLGTRMTWSADTYGTEGSLYEEAYGIVYNSNTEISDAYNKAYPQIKEQVDGYKDNTYPFFAPWNTLVTGNVLVTNDDLTTIASTPTHKLKTSITGSYNVPEEENMTIVPTASTKSSLNPTVDELATYGDKEANAAGINATALGNPKFSHSAVTLTNDMVTAKVSDYSDVHNIEMSKIGILDTTNANIFEEKPEKVNILDVAYDTQKAIITWEPVEKASEYDIVVTKDTTTLAEETCYNVFATNKFEFNLDGAGTYNISITAKGLSKEDNFEITGEATFEIGDINSVNLANAQAILANVIASADEGSVTVTDLEALKAADTTSETAIYSALEAANVTPSSLEITSVEPIANSTIVRVEAKGLPANSLATVMVTNPELTSEDAATKETFNMGTVRYVGAVVADSTGKITVEFDTRRNDIDYTGDYNIYVKNDAADVAVSRTYKYGTVELGDIKFIKDDVEISKADLNAGDIVTLSIPVKNRLERDLMPEAYLGFYQSKALKSASVNNTTEIKANSDGTISMTVEIPSSYTADTELKLFMWDNEVLLRPLTTTRVITE